MTHGLTFDAVAEARPGAKWKARWERSWPAYEAWFRARGGDSGPSRSDCEAALRHHMPELVQTHQALTRLAGGGDRAARFLSGWCPPAYLGGCSLAAQSDGTGVRLVRNYDLSPELNEGLLLRSEWTGRPVMGMVEFLWGLSDGVNDAGLAIALAYGGRGGVGPGFGITTLVRYLLETCDDVAQALARLETLPSHMAYNLVLADRSGEVASVELDAGGGLRRMPQAIATNHQHGGAAADRPGFTRTVERHRHLQQLLSRGAAPETLRQRFLERPLRQDDYAGGFGTLFTAEYDPMKGAVTLAWPSQSWTQRLEAFAEATRTIIFHDSPTRPRPTATSTTAADAPPTFAAWLDQAASGAVDWTTFGPAAARYFVPAGERHCARSGWRS